MKILTWNIQATKGCDDRYDITRIIDIIKQYGDLDAICLQELSKHISDLNNDDQPSLIHDQFSDYHMLWGPGFSAPDRAGTRREFGNMTLVKRDLLKNSRVHSLPSPSVSTLQMPRTMVEAVLATGDQQVALFNAHLAFHSSDERMAQIQMLTALRDQVTHKTSLDPGLESVGPYRFTNFCSDVILCGDLNVDSDSDMFKDYISDCGWVDCWTVQSRYSANDSPQRQPTCGCFDHMQWPQGAHTRDYFLATKNIASKTIQVEVDVNTDASDHQPVLLEIAL